MIDDILITSKTHNGKAACVGGLILDKNRFVRLLNQGGYDQNADTDFQIDDIWFIEYVNRSHLEPPHVEDIILETKIYLSQIRNFPNYIISKGIPVFRGAPVNIFNDLLNWTANGSGYLRRGSKIPSNSVGFWISDKNLDLHDRHYIYYTNNAFFPSIKIRYIGFQEAIKTIPAGTLIKVSLTRWHKPDDKEVEERCYLQLSGWHDDKDNFPSEVDDLPF